MKTRYLLIIILVVILVIAGFFIINALKYSDRDKPTGSASHQTVETEESPYVLLNNNIINLLPKDQIPPLEDPNYTTVDKAHFLDDTDKVFVLESVETTYIFPRKIMVWHEIVNETIDGNAVSITYCPLTGSVIGYEGNIAGYKNNTYGTSGKLLNSNLVLYDRETDSSIPQILGVAVNNALEGNELATRPVYWADWSDAKAAYPDALVLSLETGYHRDYFTDPYGSYDPDSPGSYYTNGEPMYKVINENDGTFIDKKIVVGVKYEDHRLALDPDLVSVKGIVEFDIGGEPSVAFYDSGLKAIRVFSSSLDSQKLKFTYDNETITDNRGTQWSANGTSENSENLEPLTYFDVMWFAWYAYYPETNVIK